MVLRLMRRARRIKLSVPHSDHRLAKDGEGYSTEREQHTGIRQGCPLSPYLFTLLMTALFEDVHEEVGEKCSTTASREAGSTELLYADDTLLIGSKAKPLNLLLKTIEKHSDRYGMYLNKKNANISQSTPKTKTKSSLRTALSYLTFAKQPTSVGICKQAEQQNLK